MADTVLSMAYPRVSACCQERIGSGSIHHFSSMMLKCHRRRPTSIYRRRQPIGTDNATSCACVLAMCQQICIRCESILEEDENRTLGFLVVVELFRQSQLLLPVSVQPGFCYSSRSNYIAMMQPRTCRPHESFALHVEWHD